MALTRVAASGGDSGSGTTSSFAVAWEGGFTPQAGDVAVISGHVSATSLTMSITAGWTDLPSVTWPYNISTTSRLYGWYKVLSAGESPPTITGSGAITGGWSCQVYRGAAASPIGQVAASGTDSVTSLALGTLTGVLAGSALAAHVHARVQNTTIPTGITPDADYTETVDHVTSRPSTSANVAMSASNREGVAAGNYSGDTFSVTNSVASSMGAVVVEILAGATTQNLTAAGVGSGGAFGAATLSPGAVGVTATGVETGLAFGAATLAAGPVTVAAASLSTGEAFGAAQLSPGAVGVAASALPSGEAFGAASVALGPVGLTATGVGPGEAFGAATVAAGAVTLTASGITSGEAFGLGTVAAGLAGGGIGSGEAFGGGTVSAGAVTLAGAGVPTGEAFGTALIGNAGSGGEPQQLIATGVPSAEAHGRAVVARMAVKEQEMAPCLWDVDAGCSAEWATFDPAVQTRATKWATEMLWMLSGRRFGTCPVTVRPCQGCSGQSWQTYGVMYQDGVGGSWVPFLMDGQWSNCGCVGTHACHPDSEVWLPGPVAAISEVTVDGVVVAADAYRVDDGNWLVRHDGGTWPRTQNLSRRAGAADTFVVTYLRGTPVPEAGKIAAGALAVEFARACAGAGACRLPREAQSIIRQGVELQLVSEDAADMLTGVTEADQWLRAVNPGKLRQRPMVASLDVTAPRITTWE